MPNNPATFETHTSRINWHLLFLAAGSALVLNASTVVLHTNYLASVCLVMIGTPAVVLAATFRNLKKRDAWMLLSFITFSNVITTVIEKLMLYFDVWGFSNAHFRLLGFTFLSAPIEEYMYWWMSAVIVAVTYVCFSRSQTKTITYVPNWFDIAATMFAARYETIKSQEATEANQGSKTYLENDKTITVHGKTYKRGDAFPTWAVVAISVTLFASVLYRYFKGSSAALVSTVLVFLCVAYPNELYSLHNGLWVYNQQRILNVFLFGVPVEEWFMYTMSPLAGGMLLSILYRRFCHEVL